MAAAEEQTRLQIGHVLFIDIVGYSKLLVNQQSELLRELNEVVSGTNEFREAEADGKLIRLPTGDGMNQRQNIAGAGINMAQRVMDCGDAGQILVSKHVAEDLEQHDRWRPLPPTPPLCSLRPHPVKAARIRLLFVSESPVAPPNPPRSAVL